MFHVKHWDSNILGPSGAREKVHREQALPPASREARDPRKRVDDDFGYLFSDTEVAKYHVQHILNVDPTREAAQGAGSDPQLLGQ